LLLLLPALLPLQLLLLAVTHESWLPELASK
jgi:hypothetical protein